jgi:outer membrane lipoprotein-sorting protein
MNFRLPISLTLLTLATASLHAQKTRQLDALLTQLDSASKSFKSAQATVIYDNYTRAVHDHALQSGSIYIERSGSGVNMGAVFFNPGPDGKPAKSPDKILAFDGATFQIFSPGTNQVDIFKSGANQARYESFLTLGFGGSGHDLDKSWTIQDQGPETVDGVKTEKLDLVSKDPDVKNMFTHITIWIDPTRDISLKQISFAPNGDFRTVTYSNIRPNAKIDKHPYAIGSGATKIPH